MNAGSARAWARELGVSADTIAGAIRRGELRAVRLGSRRFLIRREDVGAWLESRRVRPTEHAERVVERVLAREEAKRRS